MEMGKSKDYERIERQRKKKRDRIGRNSTMDK